jgi:hypothetical protein
LSFCPSAPRLAWVETLIFFIKRKLIDGLHA